MGIASHLGSWLLGTVKNTTGTTAGTVRNMGATIVAQTYNLTAAQVAGLTGSLGAIPAGSCITNVQFITSTLFASATTLKVTIGGTDYAAAATITAAGVYPQTAAAGFAPTAANTGTTDDLVTFTATGTSSTGAATIVISYVVRSSDGTTNPASA
jgi:hypothetical protein